jgi:kinesin family protein 11
MIEYVDQWPLTKGRDAILREWRKGGRSRAPSDAVSGEHIPSLPPTESMVYRDADKRTASDPAGLDDVENMNPAPPPRLSSGSPLSSSATQVPDPVPQPEKKGVIKPTGTLTDRPINAPESRRSRRAR